jgi:spore coat protein U-like protein
VQEHFVMPHRAIGLLLAGCAGVLVPHDALALLATCNVSATAINFGTYNPLSGTPDGATGTATVTCSGLVGLLVSWTVTLSTGSSGSFSPRLLNSGGNSLSYNLYTTAAHSTVWGDGSGSTGVMNGSTTLIVGSNSVNYTVYGVVPASQDRAPGTYMDTVIVTVTY